MNELSSVDWSRAQFALTALLSFFVCAFNLRLVFYDRYHGNHLCKN